jgi:fructose/tagatose bisphosphate aldolase
MLALKIDFHRLLTDFAFQFCEFSFLSAILPGAAEGATPVILEFPPPAVQITGMHLQCASYFRHVLSAIEAAYRRLLELFGELPSSLHLQFPLLMIFRG